jgi:ankyrin repeat protein
MPNDTPLHKACHNGELDNVKKLLESGEYDVNECESIGAPTRRP